MMKNNSILFFSGTDIYSLLTMESCIEAMKDGFSALSKGEAVMPVRTRLEMDADNANALFMPVYLPHIQKVGVKTVTNIRNNPAKGLPMVHAMMLLFDSSTGVPLAVMDGEAITAMRTGAVSGLATSLLAGKEASVAAIIGTGTQGETQLEAVCAVRKIHKAYVFDIQPEKAEAFADKMSKRLNIEVVAADSAAVLEEADVICTATPSRKPVFEDRHLKSGVHINGVGSYKPDMIEIPPETIARAKVVVDQMQGCLAEAGDLLQPIAQGIITQESIHGDLGDVVTGKIPARESDDEITVFKSVGVAVQDLVTADLILRSAQEKGAGTRLSLS
ncbi:ornithine cyclodeaminase family protein [Desulfopila inferna]|uniref:ornithine cyclodeaminase family protein n=1 Tax=Desulfopila inferna TaxID=468528 RepID=UPI0019646DD1|nr:NAD(P)-binding domain-containing protein [Desulfopila inferna]MBM9604355.1 NAD(P)-binding domain-containing protein [Desulfopila inferna]